MKTNSKIVFERRHIVEQDFQILLDVFNPQTMTQSGLIFLCGILDVRIGGYTGCQENPIVVMEMRSFMRALGRHWGPGFAAYFCDLASAFFFIYACAQLDHLVVIDRAASADYVVLPRQDEVENFFREAALGIYTLGQQAGLSTSDIHQRQRQLAGLLASSFRQYCKA
jgi:hypothetical protein